VGSLRPPLRRQATALPLLPVFAASLVRSRHVCPLAGDGTELPVVVAALVPATVAAASAPLSVSAAEAERGAGQRVGRGECGASLRRMV